ncbi:MAG: peptide ABC transporter substrate-binding protein, partial [Ardenticatenaceae bacterium]
MGNNPPTDPEATPQAEPMVLDYNFGSEPLVLDPAFAINHTSVELLDQLFEGLTTFDRVTAEPVAALALEWDVSEDGLTYTFKMRENALWVNQAGEPHGAVTAEDVAYAIKRACNPATATPLKQALFVIKGCQEVNLTEGIPDLDSIGVRAVGRFTVEFTLAQPAAYLPAVLALPVARPVPREIVEQLGPGWSEPASLLTSGPYRLTSWIPDASLTLDKNTLYYNASAVQIVHVNGTLLADEAALELYRANRLDTARVPPTDVPAVLTDASLAEEVTRVAEPCTVAYGFTAIKPPVDNDRIRRALSYAIDRPWLAGHVLHEGQIPARHFAPPDVVGAPGSDTNGIDGNVAAAQQLLAEAGYPDGQGFPGITLAHPEGEEYASVAAAISEMWRSTLNIAVAVQAQADKVYRETIESTTPLDEAPHVWLLGWCAPFPDEHAWVADVFGLESVTEGRRTSYTLYGERVTVQPGANHVRRAPGPLD